MTCRNFVKLVSHSGCGGKKEKVGGRVELSHEQNIATRNSKVTCGDSFSTNMAEIASNNCMPGTTVSSFYRKLRLS